MPRDPAQLAEALRQRPAIASLLARDDVVALDPRALDRLDRDPAAFWDDDEDEDRLPYEVEDGVARLPVSGVLMQRGWSFWCFRLDGYDTLLDAVTRACEDPAVRCLVLHCDSPGGEVAGLFDSVRAMRTAVAASGKPCVAIADELAASAAYAIACVADEIVLPETATVGSVGVIASLRSWAKANDLEGLDVRVITSGAEKADGNPNRPIDPAAVARLQARVDELGGIFARWVAERRSMTPEAVRALEAGVRHGPAAVAAGLADRVAPVAEVLAALRARHATPAPRYAWALTSMERSSMDALKTLLALAGESTDAQVLGRVTALTAFERDALAATKRETPAEALGVIAAGQAALAQVEAQAAVIRGLEAEIDRRDRAALIAEGRAAGKLTPAMTPWAEAQPLAGLRAYLDVAPAVISRETLPEPKPEGADAALGELVARARAQGWAALTVPEKVALTRHDPKLADELRGAQG